MGLERVLLLRTLVPQHTCCVMVLLRECASPLTILVCGQGANLAVVSVHGLATNNTGVWSGSEPSCGECTIATIDINNIGSEPSCGECTRMV